MTTLAELRQIYGPSRYLGPTVDTDWGTFHITGYSNPGSGGKITVYHTVVDGSSTMIGNGPDLVTPDNWYNPKTWNWGHILGKVESWVEACSRGAVSGVGSTMAGTLVVNLIARGAPIILGPNGYAAIAIAGCVANILH